jgi:hypothetical protein
LRVVRPANGILRIESKYWVTRKWTDTSDVGQLVSVDSSGVAIEGVDGKDRIRVANLSAADQIFFEKLGIDWVRSSFTLERFPIRRWVFRFGSKLDAEFHAFDEKDSKLIYLKRDGGIEKHEIRDLSEEDQAYLAGLK